MAPPTDAGNAPRPRSASSRARAGSPSESICAASSARARAEICVPGGDIDESPERSLVAVNLPLPDGDIVAKGDAAEVGVVEGGPVRVRPVEGQEALVKADSLQRRRGLIRGRRLPFHEFCDVSEDGATRFELERVFALRRGLLAGLIELQGVIREKVEHRRPVAVGALPLRSRSL